MDESLEKQEAVGQEAREKVQEEYEHEQVDVGPDEVAFARSLMDTREKRIEVMRLIGRFHPSWETVTETQYLQMRQFYYRDLRVVNGSDAEFPREYYEVHNKLSDYMLNLYRFALGLPLNDDEYLYWLWQAESALERRRELHEELLADVTKNFRGR